MTLENARHYSFTARLDCRYIVSAPDALDDGSMLVVTLHGFSANPEVMLRLTALMMGPRHVIAAAGRDEAAGRQPPLAQPRQPGHDGA